MKNSLFSGLGTLSNIVIGFVFVGFTIRYLGTERGGFLLTLEAIVGLHVLLGGLGIGTAAVRSVAKLHTEGNATKVFSIIGSVITFNLIAAVLFSIVILISFDVLFRWSKLPIGTRNDALQATILIVGSFLLRQISTSWQVTYYSLQRYDLVSLLGTAFGLLHGLLGIAVLRMVPSMTAISVVGLLVAAIRLLLDGWFVQRLIGRVTMPAWDLTWVRSSLSFGGWTLLSGIGGVLFTSIDKLVITYYLGSGVVPYYAIPQRFYGQIHSALSGQMHFVYPMFSSFGDNAIDPIRRTMDRLRWFVATFSGIGYILMATCGASVLSFVISTEFGTRAFPFIFLASIQGFFHTQMIVPFYTTWSLGLGAPNSVIQLVNGIFVTATQLLIIPWMGTVGAGIAQLWICPLAIAHSIWTEHLLSADGSIRHWLKSYISPMVMLAIWASLVVTANGLIVDESSVVYFITVAIGGILGLTALVCIEVILHPNSQRISTIISAIRELKTILKIWKGKQNET